jgi:hypothetical protein
VASRRATLGGGALASLPTTGPIGLSGGAREG